MPAICPVPRAMARSMFSFGMFSALAEAVAARRRGLASASPPPILAAMVTSLMSRLNTRPRLASVAAFLCLMVAHLEWPDIVHLPFPLLARRRRKTRPSRRSGAEVAGIEGAGKGGVGGAADDGAAVGEDRQLIRRHAQTQEIVVVANLAVGGPPPAQGAAIRARTGQRRSVKLIPPQVAAVQPRPLGCPAPDEQLQRLADLQGGHPAHGRGGDAPRVARFFPAPPPPPPP